MANFRRKYVSYLLIIPIVLVTAGPPPPVTRDDELEDYCSAHKFEKLAGGLSFTKEIVTMEYADVGAFKAIHCCLRGYRSIEWYKDGRPYPWPGAISHFILYPESANQTIYTQETRVSDAGQYSCRARNDTDTVAGDITLKIVGEPRNGYTGKPLPSYKPVSQLVPLGDSARLFCEAYVGKVDLPDARNSVAWFKARSNITVPSQGRISQHRVSREDEHIVGSYLEIDRTTLEDYGEYECRISNGADEEVTLSAHIYRREPQFMFGMRRDSWKRTLLFTVLGIVLIGSALAFYKRCWLPLAVLWHDRFARVEVNDGKDFDALVCYHEKDLALAVGKLVPTLEAKHGYKCTSLQLSHLRRNWGMEIGPHTSQARRVIVLLSPNSLTNDWTDVNVTSALKQLSTIKSQVIAIIPQQDLSAVTTFAKSPSHCLDLGFTSHSVILDRVTILQWKLRSDNDLGGYKFWCRLRLLMPPIRVISFTSNDEQCQDLRTIMQTGNINSTQHKTHSQESLEVLV